MKRNKENVFLTRHWALGIDHVTFGVQLFSLHPPFLNFSLPSTQRNLVGTECLFVLPINLAYRLICLFMHDVHVYIYIVESDVKYI